MTERFLVTGALGCIGAWVVRQLLAEGVPTVAFDPSPDAHRLDQIVPDSDRGRLTTVAGDVRELAPLQKVVAEYDITNIVHLAALQVPFCKANPVLGAQVNVVGTVNIFEAAKHSDTVNAPVVYASSVAAYDYAEEGNVAPPQPTGHAGTLYGVYKRANEGTAHVYRESDGVPSVGLRPHVVYGVGRDQGMTAEPTHAVLAAVAGLPYTIPYGGRSQMQYAQDVASAFVAASRSGHPGADVYNLPGAGCSMSDFVAAIETAVPESVGAVKHLPDRLPFPDEADASAFTELVGPLPATDLEAGVRQTANMFRDLLASGRVKAPSSSL